MRTPQRCAWALALFFSGPWVFHGAASGAHPPFRLLDRDGKNVLETGQPISTIQSCRHCHDTQYIATHSYHAWLGGDERSAPGSDLGRRPWDWSPGPFGRWNPLTYRYLSPQGDPRIDQGTAEWIATFARHAGGGPALVGQGGTPLADRGAGGRPDPDHFYLDSSGQAQAWDWRRSGVVEMNCFLCHTSRPDNRARLGELHRGRFQWANTATLASTGIVDRAESGWTFARQRFLPDGRVEASKLGLQSPSSENCALCHGMAGRGDTPLALDLSLRQWSTATKGQVFSPQRISDSAANLLDKQRLARAWDVHAERLLECTSCHFSLNNPIHFEPAPPGSPKHLAFEPRRLAIGQYLERPSHQFAKGHTPQGSLARHLDGTMRRCGDCHDASGSHTWLPYREAHFAKLDCEACHIPQAYAPAIRQVDWTMLTTSGEPQVSWRGIEGEPGDPTAVIRGFRPVLLPKQGLDGRTRLAPHNLISAWYWVGGGDTARPVSLADLKAALLLDGKYHPEVARALGDGRPRLDTAEKVDAVRRRLAAVGVADPQIQAEVQPYSLHHGVGPAREATRQCEICHAGDSRLGEPFVLASYVPGSVLPAVVQDGGVELKGRVQRNGEGPLCFEPSTRKTSLYVLGHDRWWWIDLLGSVFLTGVLLGAIFHAGLRLRLARRSTRAEVRSVKAETPEENGSP